MSHLRAHVPDPYFDHVVLDPEQHHRLHNARLALAALQSAIGVAPAAREVDLTVEELTGLLSLVLDPLDAAIEAQSLPQFLDSHPRRR